MLHLEINKSPALSAPADRYPAKRNVADFFISHSKEDGDFAELMQIRLGERNYTAWIYSERLRAGEDWRAEIDEGIRCCDALIAIMSPAARKSEYVTYEWAFALGLGVKVIPIILKSTHLHPRLDTLQYLDFTNRAVRPWDRLLDILDDTRKENNHFAGSPP